MQSQESLRRFLDEALRDGPVPCSVDEPHECEAPPPDAVLGDWVVVSHWMSRDGKNHFYHRVASSMMTPHAVQGLLRYGLEDDYGD